MILKYANLLGFGLMRYLSYLSNLSYFKVVHSMHFLDQCTGLIVPTKCSLIFKSNVKKAHKNSLCHLMQRTNKILFKILEGCDSFLCLFHLQSVSLSTKLLFH